MNETEFEDIILTCCDCHKEYIWSSGEQTYFFSKQLSQPKRCPDCRKLRRVHLVPDNKVQ